jgi:hypothetical protein
LKIVAEQVNVHGLTQVSALSMIKGIGQGIVQVRDKDAKTTLLLGTSSSTGSGPGMRIMPVEGTGVGITPKSDKGGFFVSGSSAHVGINIRRKVREPLHVQGQVLSDKIVAGHDGKGPAVLLRRASTYHAAVLGKPNEKGAQKYSIGRGSRAQRSLTFHGPSVAEYDGTGKAPLMVYMSPDKVLAAVNADSGNLYLTGTMSVQERTAYKKKWTSGSDSNLNIDGGLSLGLPAGVKKGTVKMFYPSKGDNPSFSIRANSPDEAQAVDTKLFITSDKEAGKIGINTLKPKVTLDARGHLHIQTDSRGNGMIYYPQSGDQAGFYVRSTDTPTANDREATRLYLSPSGHVGINTVAPETGLDIQAKAGVKNGGDVNIAKGNLRVHDGIRHVNKKHMLLLDSDNILSAVGVEDAVSVGTAKPLSMNAHHLHIQGTEAPILRVENTGKGHAAIALQSGKGAWTLNHGADKNFHFNATHGGKMPPLMIDTTGRLVVEGAEGPPEYGIQLETKADYGTPENDVIIKKGGLNLFGGIFKRVKQKDGRWIVWRLYPKGFSNLNGLTVNGKLAIGVSGQQQEDLFMETHRTVSLGDTGFLGSTGAVGTMSYNEYTVLSEGQSERKLHKKSDFAAALRLSNDGKVEFEGTAAKGQLKMSKLFGLDPVAGRATFGKFVDFGFTGGKTEKTPLRVKGAGTAKEHPATIGFGASSEGRGHVGANDKITFISSTDESKRIAINQADGNIGVGTMPTAEDLAVITPKPDATILFTIDKHKQHSSSVKMTTGGSVEISSTATEKSGKMTIDDFSTIEFNDGKEGKGQTVFERIPPVQKDKNAEGFPAIAFQSAKVGVNVENPEKLLHVNGASWFQGKVFIKKGFARSQLMEELSQSFLQTGESAKAESLDDSQLFSDSEDVDVVGVLEQMSKLVRSNKAKLETQRESIVRMESELSQLQARR